MPKLTIALRDNNGALDAGLDRRIEDFLKREQSSLLMAARTATTGTRANFAHRREPIAPRPGRSSTGGRMKQHLTWVARDGQVQFDMATADRQAPHWLIQEIGTGQRATVKRHDTPNPLGRPKKGATYVRTVKSQKGRRISAGLVFANNGRYSPPGARRDEQLQWASRVTGVPQRTPGSPQGQAAGIRIRREIRGQHFVKKGGEQGFREYRSSVLAAARQAFRKGARS